MNAATRITLLVRSGPAVRRALLCAALAIAMSMATLPRAALASAGGMFTTYFVAADGQTLLGMDVYLPAGAGPFPVVMAVHGGGWHKGSRASQGRDCGALTAIGIACVSPDYRMAPEYPYPAANLDLVKAYAAIQAGAGAWNIDPSRIGGWGLSAGGNLVGWMQSRDYFTAIATWSGPSDLTTVLDQGCTCVWQVNAFVPTDEAKHDGSSALFQDAGDAPTHIANSTDELIPLAQAQELADAQAAAGVPFELDVIPGTKHAGGYFDIEWPATSAFFLTYL
jgi:acetyl esterase